MLWLIFIFASIIILMIMHKKRKISDVVKKWTSDCAFPDIHSKH